MCSELKPTFQDVECVIESNVKYKMIAGYLYRNHMLIGSIELVKEKEYELTYISSNSYLNGTKTNVTFSVIHN